jgi:hypothetical protein
MSLIPMPQVQSFEETLWAEPDLFLMADPDLITSSHNATFHLCPMQKADGPQLLPIMPWEGGDGSKVRPVHQDPIDGSVLFDPHRHLFHLWYRTHNRELSTVADPAAGDNHTRAAFHIEGSNCCYAVSEDGQNWQRPRVGQVRWRGSYDNNMFRVAVPPVLTDHLSGVVPNYTGSGPRLVCTVYSAFNDPIYPNGITQMFSDDGVNWQPHFPPTLPMDGDAHALTWDERRRCYICTTRSHAHAIEVRRMQQAGFSHLRNKRHVAIASSRDLLHWGPMVMALEADEKDAPSAQLYHMYVLPYGHLYLGFVQMFYMSKDMSFGPLEMQLAVSRDALSWKRVAQGEPILPRGEAGSWDSAHVSLCTARPHLEGERMRFWYGGKDTEHWQAGNAAMSSATLRQDGFACWRAGNDGGHITTAPMQLDWATWPMLSVDASGGEARLEILGDGDQPLAGCSAADCHPITDNHTRQIVTFGPSRGTFVRHTGKIRFRIHLRNASLYAIKLPNVQIL